MGEKHIQLPALSNTKRRFVSLEKTNKTKKGSVEHRLRLLADDCQWLLTSNVIENVKFYRLCGRKMFNSPSRSTKLVQSVEQSVIMSRLNS